MMETARDLNMETDEMQLVVSALRGVGWKSHTNLTHPGKVF